jgi:putative endonuclease
MFHVYILYSKKINKYYVGRSNNIEARLSSHELGMSPYTRTADDWILVYTEKYETRKAAIQREIEIKKKKSRKYIEYIISLKNE